VPPRQGGNPTILPRRPYGFARVVIELVLMVASLVRAFRIELPPYRPLTLVGRVTLQPDIPPPFRQTPRAA